MGTAYSELPNELVSAANGIDYVYRDSGGGEGTVPLVLLQHFRGNLDNWDPALIDALALARRVVTFDNAGVGGSTGTGVGADRVRAGQGQLVEHPLGRSHRLGGERRDAPREPGHERVQVGVGQRPVDPAVSFSHLRVEIVRAQDRLHGPAPVQQPGQVLHAARAWDRAGPTSICPKMAFSAAANRMSHASASSLPAPRARPRTFAIDTTGSSLSLCHSMPSDASPGPPALAASAVYPATLVRSTCGTK